MMPENYNTLQPVVAGADGSMTVNRLPQQRGPGAGYDNRYGSMDRLGNGGARGRRQSSDGLGTGPGGMKKLKRKKTVRNENRSWL